MEGRKIAPNLSISVFKRAWVAVKGYAGMG
jgi:hypothetical protein